MSTKVDLDDLKLASDLYKRNITTAGDARPTNEELLASIRVFTFFQEAGVLFGQEMLSHWATSKLINWRSIANYRNLHY